MERSSLGDARNRNFINLANESRRLLQGPLAALRRYPRAINACCTSRIRPEPGITGTAATSLTGALLRTADLLAEYFVVVPAFAAATLT